MKSKTDSTSPVQTPAIRRLSFLLVGSCLIVIALHIWGTIHPIHDNWGVHFFGFYKTWVGLVALGLILLLAIPKIQTSITNALDRFLHRLSKLPLPINFLIAASTLIGLIYLFPAKLHLLGDGAILLRSVLLGINSSEISLSFRNQPLMFWIYRVALNFHPFDAAPNPYTIYYTIDIVAALGFLALLFWSIRILPLPLLEKFLLGCFLLFSGTCQFFFGYIENYVLQFVMTTAFVITGWYSLEKRISIIIPIICFALMVMLHIGNIVFAPSLILLIIFKWKRSKLQAGIFLLAIGVIGVGAMYLLGFNLIDITRHVEAGTVDILQPFTAIGGEFPYPMFSMAHLIDWLNSSLLVAPFGLLLIVILIPTMPKDRRWKNPILLFLLATVLCGMFFTWVINSALGLARDWDLFSSFFITLTIFSIYLFSQLPLFPQRRSIIFIIVVILVCHTAAWIGVNGSEERHLARLKTLNSSTYLSKAAQLVYSEAMANFLFDTQNYSDARTYYESFMKIDSMNPRIIGNVADVYRRLGERDLYFNMLKRAVELHSPDPGVYSNLGVEYAMRKDTANAIAFNEKAISINPSISKAHANLGILYSAQKKYQIADQHFTTAINLGMKEPILFRYAGDVCLYLNDYKRGIQNYDIYLSSNPADERVRNLRNRVYAELVKQTNNTQR